MEPAPVTFLPHHRPAPLLQVAPAIADRFELRPGEHVRLQLGPRTVALRAVVNETAKPDLVELPARAMQALRLPASVPLQLRYRPDGGLEPGPFIGIMSHPRQPRNPYQLQTAFFRRLLGYGIDRHLGVFIFSPGDVLWRERAIRGWVYARGWRQRLFPFPQAVYDRTLPTRSTVGAWRRFHKMGIPVFNSPVGSKWWQYRLLAQDPLTRDALPDTRRIFSGVDIVTMMKRHGSIYIKSAHGGKGIDIWQVTARRGRFIVRHNGRGGRLRTKTLTSLAPLARTLATRARRPYLAQARLDLMRWNDRIFDIRVLTQKDGTGTWRVTGIGLRVGPPGSIVSNLHGGGRTAPMEPVLRTLLQDRTAEDVREESERLALRVATLIDGACACVGELGIDLALDQSERLWFLEANSRTGRNVTRSLGPVEAALAADVRPLQYASHLAGFPPVADSR